MLTLPRLELNDGNCIPALGYGTYGHKDSGEREKAYQAVKDAISVGYRHIDTAFLYEIEDQVGLAIRDSIAEGIVKREDLFVTTKLWQTFFRKEKVREGFDASLKALGLDYVDLFLFHWPVPLVYDENGN